jgi:hypothetical protein
MRSSKRICNTSPRLPLSTWFAVWHGSMAFLVLRLAVLLLFASTTLLERVRQQYRACGRAQKCRHH